MAKKKYDYFEALTIQSSYAQRAAAHLDSFISDYTDITGKAQEMRVLEHEADRILHAIVEELNRSFITPIDREDIMMLSSRLDDIIDAIEKVSDLFDILSITKMRPEAKKFSALIVEACDAVYQLTKDFSKFKDTKTIAELIIRVNQVEGEGDTLYREVVKELYQNEKDAIELIKWKEVYDNMERILDRCEDSANLFEGAAIKNS